TTYATPRRTAKYFDRNASPRNAPASACQSTDFFSSPSQNANTDAEENRMSGVSVVMSTAQTFAGSSRKARAASAAFPSSMRRRTQYTPAASAKGSSVTGRRSHHTAFDTFSSRMNSQPIIGG